MVEVIVSFTLPEDPSGVWGAANAVSPKPNVARVSVSVAIMMQQYLRGANGYCNSQ
jgi:hypothetical protein